MSKTDKQAGPSSAKAGAMLGLIPLLMENIFLFYWKETSSDFNWRKPCLLVYYSYMSLNFTAKFFFPFEWKKCICLDWYFFYHIFLKISFQCLSQGWTENWAPIGDIPNFKSVLAKNWVGGWKFSKIVVKVGVGVGVVK